MENEAKNSRRSFLNYIFGGVIIAFLGMIFYPIFKFLSPPEVPQSDVSSVRVCKTSEINLNEGKIFKFGTKPGILVRTPDNQFKAFIAICTHLDCTVQYRPDMKLIWCACHNGRYDLSGINIAGPPPQPLTPLEVHVKEQDIHVSIRQA